MKPSSASPTVRHALKKARSSLSEAQDGGNAIDANALPDTNVEDADAQSVAPGVRKKRAVS